MVLTIKHRYIYYRRYEIDIWGLCLTDYHAGLYRDTFVKLRRTKVELPGGAHQLLAEVGSKLLRFFYKMFKKKDDRRQFNRRRYIYRFDIGRVKIRYRRPNPRFDSVRITRLYFLTYKDYQFRKLFKKASKMDGNLETNYCYLLECRLVGLVYRTNLLNSPFEIMKFIRGGYVLVNFAVIKNISHLTPVSTVFSFSKKCEERLLYFLLRRLRARAVYFNTPKFMFFSYKFMFGFLFRYPARKDILYPINLDMQRLTGYY